MCRSAARSARSVGDFENASRSSTPASGSASTCTAIAIARLVNSSTVSARLRGGLRPGHRQADQRLTTEQRRHRHQPANERNMSARSAWPSSKASHSGHRHTEQQHVETRRRQSQPAGQQAQRNDQDGIGQREEQRRDQLTTPATGIGWAGRTNATTIAPSVDVEMTANIST